MRLVGATPRQISVVSAVEAAVAAFAGVASASPSSSCSDRCSTVSRSPARPSPRATSRFELDRRPVRRDRRPDRRGRVGTPRPAAGPDLAARRQATSDLRSAAGSCGSSRCSPASPCWPTSTRPANRAAMAARCSNCSWVSCSSRGTGSGRAVVHDGGLSAHGRSGPIAPPRFIAGRRLLDNPKAAFRFVSGLVIALFVTSAAIGALSSIAAASTYRARERRERHSGRPVLQLLDNELPCLGPGSLRLEPVACSAPRRRRASAV